MRLLQGSARPERQRAQAIPIRIAIAATTINASEAAPIMTSWSDNAPVSLIPCRTPGSVDKIDLKSNAKGAPFCKGIASMVREHANANSGARIALTPIRYPGGNLLSMNDERPLTRVVVRPKQHSARLEKNFKSGASAGRNVGKT